jgi:hypothetical protein
MSAKSTVMGRRSLEAAVRATPGASEEVMLANASSRDAQEFGSHGGAVN